MGANGAVTDGATGCSRGNLPRGKPPAAGGEDEHESTPNHPPVYHEGGGAVPVRKHWRAGCRRDGHPATAPDGREVRGPQQWR